MCMSVENEKLGNGSGIMGLVKGTSFMPQIGELKPVEVTGNSTDIVTLGSVTPTYGFLRQPLVAGRLEPFSGVGGVMPTFGVFENRPMLLAEHPLAQRIDPVTVLANQFPFIPELVDKKKI